MPDYFVVHRFPGIHELMREAVCLNEMRAQSNEHLSDGGFSRGNSSGQADFQHEFPVA